MECTEVNKTNETERQIKYIVRCINAMVTRVQNSKSNRELKQILSQNENKIQRF